MGFHGIITGDIVSSQQISIPVRERLFDDIAGLLKELKKRWINSYETYRGDSLQCEVKSPELALRVALIIRSFFRAYIPPDLKTKLPIKKRKKGCRNQGLFYHRFRYSFGHRDWNRGLY